MSLNLIGKSNPIGFDLVFRFCDRQLRRLFGEFGRLEVSIEDVLYDHDLDEWLIRIGRKVNDVIIWYELGLDNQTGETTLFRRSRQE